MNCPCCNQPTLVETLTKNGVLVDICKSCKGVWLDRGEIFLFSRKPKRLEAALAGGLEGRRPTERVCPRCRTAMEVGQFLRPGLEVDQCPSCEGYWFDAGELRQAIEFDRGAFALETEAAPPDPEFVGGGKPGDVELAAEGADERVHARARDMASGMLPLPNLWIRSAGVMFLLYAILGGVLIALAEFRVIPPGIAVAIGVAIVVLQFVFGPWLMDLSLRWLYKFSWVDLDELPPHLAEFVTRVAGEQNMKVPSFGIIHDGAPNAFTYGHTPNNMRIVITRGILDLLEPEEVEGVVAHEIGHGKNWDMLLMTIVQLVPLLLFYAYRACLNRSGNDDKKEMPYRLAIGVGAYVLYIASEYIVLWFSRCREYYADRFAGDVTGNPNALASALVKIGYGLAARGAESEESAGEADKKKKSKKAAPKSSPMLDAVGAMGIFDRKSAVAMVASVATVASAEGGSSVSKQSIKSAMQWDLWNPWAKFYELNSTHPLIANRLQYLGDQAAAMGQEPYVLFDRRKPESYWDDFFVDVLVMFLPLLLAAAGLGVGLALTGLTLQGIAAHGAWTKVVALPLLGLGLGSLFKTISTYRGGYFAPLTVANLLHKVKVSSVRPVPARLKGTIIGKGIPGLIWSEDFVMQDQTGILFLDYRQPLHIWEWLFGLFRAGSFAGRPVEVAGWFRRSPVPYLEIKTLTVDGVTRRCYAYHAKMAWAILLTIGGLALAIWGAL
jgi:Zn-dependent protease with chaperone function/Zn-finger nucleic acid-binding protein